MVAGTDAIARGVRENGRDNLALARNRNNDEGAQGQGEAKGVKKGRGESSNGGKNLRRIVQFKAEPWGGGSRL